jgi:hypothetical protein
MAYRGRNFTKRGAGHPRKRVDGRMADSRVAFCDILWGKVNIRQKDYSAPGAEDVQDESQGENADGMFADAIREQGPSLWLEFDLSWTRNSLSLNLTNLTTKELEVLRTVVDLAFDLAEPVVKQRDKVAWNAKEAGDDSYARVYRPIPVVAIREGKIIPYGEGVRHGSADVPAGPESRSDESDHGPSDGRGGGVRGAGNGLDDEASADYGSADDGETAD